MRFSTCGRWWRSCLCLFKSKCVRLPFVAHSYVTWVKTPLCWFRWNWVSHSVMLASRSECDNLRDAKVYEVDCKGLAAILIFCETPIQCCHNLDQRRYWPIKLCGWGGDVITSVHCPMNWQWASHELAMAHCPSGSLHEVSSTAPAQLWRDWRARPGWLDIDTVWPMQQVVYVSGWTAEAF